MLLLVRWISEAVLATKISSLFLRLEFLLDFSRPWDLLLFKSFSAAALIKSYLVILLGELLWWELCLHVTVLVRDVMGLTIREETMARMNELLLLLLSSVEFAESSVLVVLAGVSNITYCFCREDNL